jgi:hypothetical protein
MRPPCTRRHRCPKGGIWFCSVCVFITAVPITKLFAWGEGDCGGHVLRETTSRCLSGLVCSSRTSERRGEGGCVKEGGCQGSSVAGQPQCPRLWHSSTPNARSLSHSPSAPTPSFTQSPYPPRSLVRDERTHPHRPRLVVSHGTCPPLSSSPPASCSNKHTLGSPYSQHGIL